MTTTIAGVVFAATALLSAGCASRKYVRNTTAPVEAKIDQTSEQANRHGQAIEGTRSDLKEVDERTQKGISAATERASTADQHAQAADQHAGAADQRAGEATNRANEASQSADRVASGVRQMVDHLEDYQMQTSVNVLFKFDQAVLSDDGRRDLDKLAGDLKSGSRYFIAVEGYTDPVGPAAHNEELSRRRAEAVTEYLVAQHDVPLYRIHVVGLGAQKPADPGKTRDARAKNRRVEVKVYMAADITASLAENR